MMAGSGMGSFGGQNVMQLMRNDRGSSNALAAMLVSCNAHVGFQAPRTGLGHGLDDMAMHHACGQKRAFYPAFDGSGGALEEMEDDVYGDVDLAHSGGSVEKKRRLSFDQVRSLERSFEVENKLEPERKMQLARELNLQPRQVAVWFQNRRARWKIKQLERDYEMLNSSYTKLKVDLDSTLREKDSLKAEVQRLSGKPVSTESAQCTSEAPPRKATKPAPTIEVSGSRKKVVVATSHSGSNESSSELLDSDSPRTVDSNQRQQQQQQQQEASENHQQALVPSDINLLDGGPSCVDVKRELGTTTGFQADAYFLQPVQPEQGAALPWWDQWA